MNYYAWRQVCYSLNFFERAAMMTRINPSELSILTYMSIHDVVRAAMDREIFLIPSEFLGEECPRTVFATLEVAEMVLGPWEDTRDGRRHKSARGVLDHFTEGGFLTIAQDPFRKDSQAILARVDPVDREVWDFRCLDPNPGIRILGRFIGLDEFIALTWDYRENFDEFWATKIDECLDEWKRLFGDIQPHSGGDIGEYISFNFDTV
jgi:hypothetical protein